MNAGSVRRPHLIAAAAGGVLFLWLGVLEAVYALLFEGIIIQHALIGDWVRMLANLDSSLFLLAGLMYGALGLAAGLLWWLLVSRASAVFRRLRKKEPREAQDFYGLFLYVWLSLLFFFACIASLFLLDPNLNPQAAGTPLPVRFILAGLIVVLFWGLFRFVFWIVNLALSLPVLRLFRRPALHGGFAALTLLALLAVMVLPPVLAPPTSEPPAEQVFHPERNPPIVFVVLDTARADHFSSYGYHRETTPRFDELAESSVLFMDAISASPWTLPSHASMFTGLYPRAHGASVTHFRLDPGFFTLAEFLRASGYYTFGVSSNPTVGEVTGLNKGFDRFDEVWRQHGRERLTLFKLANRLRASHTDKGAREINRIVEQWLQEAGNADRPFFLFLNYMETHGPYQPPREYRERFLNPDREGPLPERVNIYDDRFVKYFAGDVELTELELDDLRSMYDAELAYLDTRVGELMDSLDRAGVLDRAIVLVMSDHGEHLGEQRLTDHQLSVYDPVLRVPLLVRYPPLLPAGKRVNGLVQLNALFPTLAEMLDVDPGSLPVAFSNPSLLPMILEQGEGLEVAFSEYESPQEILKIIRYKVPHFDVSPFDRDLISARTEALKYILTSNRTDELYVIDVDPGEKQDLCLEEDGCPEDHPLRMAIEAWMRDTPEYEPGETAASISDQQDREVLEKLRSLGYIQ